MTAIFAGIFTLLGVGTVTPYIILRIKKKLMPAIFLKIGASMLFLLTTGVSVLSAGPVVWERWKYLFLGAIIGQVFSLLGDFWLDMKDMMPAHQTAYTFAGFSSFIIGHLFFIAGLLRTYGIGAQTLLFVAGAGLLMCAIVLGTEGLMKLKYGKFKAITAVYGAVFGMSLAASMFSFLYAGRNPQALVMNLGLVVFLLSDLVLSGTYFGENRQRPVDYILNYVFYFGGQFTIALSLLWV